MKVLIICDLYPPAFGPRMGYLSKYISTYGWEPRILTEAVQDEHVFSFLTGNCPTTAIRFNTGRGRIVQKLQAVILFFLDLFFGYKDMRMYRAAKKIYKEEPFDLVLCSSFRTFPLRAALKTAAHFHVPLVVDLRDIIEQYTGNEFIAHTIPSLGGLEKIFVKYFRKHNLKIRNKVLAKADSITTISPWHVNMLKRYNPRVNLIFNGYDPEIFFPEQIVTSQFIITYTGRILSSAMRDPELLLEALSRLSKEGILSEKNCRVKWYIDQASWKVIKEKAEKAGVLPYMDFKGYVSASEIPNILNNSSVLLLLTNKASGAGPKGMMTTKFFESLAVEKPILCVRSDESYLAEAIKEANAGLAATSVEEVCEFLKQYFKEWKVKGYTTSSINKDVLHRYSRKEQAGEFASIFNQITGIGEKLTDGQNHREK